MIIGIYNKLTSYMTFILATPAKSAIPRVALLLSSQRTFLKKIDKFMGSLIVLERELKIKNQWSCKRSDFWQGRHKINTEVATLL